MSDSNLYVHFKSVENPKIIFCQLLNKLSCYVILKPFKHYSYPRFIFINIIRMIVLQFCNTDKLAKVFKTWNLH